jgi:pyruvate/2-oxoglutarate dehydrogenase complex dihydrolipoamide acyltransferase (E2) component
MTEGNIAKWHISEGASFSAGDVLLEIETDKASMDVEAQDDGVLFKIMQGDGTKGIKVGSRIGVLAEPDDDLSSLEVPKEEGEAAPAPKEQKQEQPKEEAQPQKEVKDQSARTESPAAAHSAPEATQHKSTREYPLLPSVEHLIKQNGIPHDEIAKITATGPKGITKGDVLAYLGQVKKDYPAQVASRVQALSHLDLSNIKIAPPAPKPAAAEPAKGEPAAPAPPQTVQVALPISMKPLLDAQRRVQASLGVQLPLSTFIARAADVANDQLPRSKLTQPTSSELFDEILGGSSRQAKYSRGDFVPYIQTSLPSTSRKASKRRDEGDVIDFLTGKSRPTRKLGSLGPVSGLGGSTSVFSVEVLKGDERRAQVFLERVKEVLEVEPGRLVL